MQPSNSAPVAFHDALDSNLATRNVTDIDELTTAILDAAETGRTECRAGKSSRVSHSPELASLMFSRKHSTTADERKSLSKRIWRLLKNEQVARRNEKLDVLLSTQKSRELKRILQAPVKSKCIASLQDQSGQLCTSQAEILEVFAIFYETLYDAVMPLFKSSEIPAGKSSPVCVEEIRSVLKKMKNGKTCADDGIISEMLKTDHEGLLLKIAELFSDLLAGSLPLPQSWCVSKLIVLFKKGDATLPKNYRPVAIIPVLCKLFCGLILSRIKLQLDDLQGVEQCGFRQNYSCSDVIHTLRMVAEKADEWGINVWAVSLDIEKAFDTVLFDAVFNALASAEIDADIIRVLWSLYSQHIGFVHLGSNLRSKYFHILRGVRQGDPLSPALFNNVTRIIFEKLKTKWRRERRGIEIGCLSHLMFADDTTLLASSLQDLVIMILDVIEELRGCGLKLNLDKCTVQTNTYYPHSHIEIGEMQVPVVGGSHGFKVLGVVWTLFGRMAKELRCRISAAWGRFHNLHSLLCKRDGDLQKRLRLFDTAVTSTLLWGCESWTLTKAEEQELIRVQNRMLRRIVVSARQPDELWVDWIKRATRRAREHAIQCGIRFWVPTYLQTKWRWAGHVMRMDSTRLARRATEWRDSEWNAIEEALHGRSKNRIKRPYKQRWFRWEDALRQHAKQRDWQSWQSKVTDRHFWSSEALVFCKGS